MGVAAPVVYPVSVIVLARRPEALGRQKLPKSVPSVISTTRATNGISIAATARSR